MIFKLLLWVVFFYIVLKVVRIATFYAGNRRSKHEQNGIPPFSNVEEADFEDITEKSSSPDSATSSHTEH